MKLKEFLIIILLVLILAMAVILIYKLNEESSSCAFNPFVYGASKYKEQGHDMICSCTFLEPNTRGFNFNSEGISYKEEYKGLL